LNSAVPTEEEAINAPSVIVTLISPKGVPSGNLNLPVYSFKVVSVCALEQNPAITNPNKKKSFFMMYGLE